jgi:hypothetical protein
MYLKNRTALAEDNIEHSNSLNVVLEHNSNIFQLRNISNVMTQFNDAQAVFPFRKETSVSTGQKVECVPEPV